MHLDEERKADVLLNERQTICTICYRLVTPGKDHHCAAEIKVLGPAAPSSPYLGAIDWEAKYKRLRSQLDSIRCITRLTELD